MTVAQNPDELVTVSRAKSEPFFLACLSAWDKEAPGQWQKFRTAKSLEVPRHIVERAREKLGPSMAEPQLVQRREVIVQSPAGPVGRIGHSLNENSALVAARARTHFTLKDTFWVVVAATGQIVARLEDVTVEGAGREVDRIEAACPAARAINPDDPDTLSAFKAEWEIFNKGAMA